MHHGILKVGFVALCATIAPDLSAQPRPPTVAGRATGITSTAAMSAVALRLPNLIGLTVDSATRLLARTRLPIVRHDTSTNSAPRDQVVDQQPRAGTPLSTIRSVTVFVAVPMRAVPVRGTVVTTVTGGVISPPASVSTTPPAGLPPSAIVPQLVGRNARSVYSLLIEARLRLDRTSVAEFSDLADSGFVFQQHPLARTRVDTASPVKVWISLGPHPTPPTLATPNVLDRTLTAADQMLRSARLIVGHVDTIFRSSGRGLVEHQLPEPGALAHPGDEVALRIAMALPLIPVPSVIGLRRTEAQLLLRESGLALGQVTPVTVSGRDTVIVTQSPAAQTGVVRGTFVDVEESQPIVRRRTVVPNLAGLTGALATERLARDSLAVGTVVISDTGVAPVVVAQRPVAGDSAFVHDRVNLTFASRRVPGRTTNTPSPPPTTTMPLPPVGSPPPTIVLVEVPAVTNLSFELARRLIDSRGLAAVSTSTDTGRVFIVRSQRPAAGSFVPAGASVTLALEPLHLRSVPHLIGLKRAAAVDHANADGFTMFIQNRRRVLLQIFERVVGQEPDTLTLGRGDQVIQVDLATPLVPPMPAGVVLVLAALGTALKVRSTRGPRGHGPLTDLDIALVMDPPAPPVPSPIPNDRVIRTAITFALDVDRSEWTVESEAKSLIAHIRTHV